MSDIKVVGFTSPNKTQDENIYDNAEAYFATLHSMSGQGRLSAAFDDNFHFSMNGSPAHVLKKIMMNLEDHKYSNAYCTVNLFNGFMYGTKPTGNEHQRKYLFGFDNLMFDFDCNASVNADKPIESRIMERFVSFCKNNEIPLPNAYSTTGSGGLHIYYTMEMVSPALEQAVSGIKYLMADKFVDFMSEIEEEFGVKYKVDTQVFDYARLDRIPGTINTKTGRMCEFFVLKGVPMYTFKKLLNYATYSSDIDNMQWSKFERDAKARFFSDRTKPRKKIIMNQYKRRKKIQKTNIRTKEECQEIFKKVAQRRVEGFFNLAKQGFTFERAREKAIFWLRVSARAAGYNQQKEEELMRELNNKFYEPLDDHSLFYQTEPKFNYRSTNDTIARDLGLNANEEPFVTAFGKKNEQYSKPYGFTKKEEKKIYRLQTIAKYKLEHPEATAKQTAKDLNLTNDMVTRPNMYLNKHKGELHAIAETPIDDYKFWVIMLDKVTMQLFHREAYYDHETGELLPCRLEPEEITKNNKPSKKNTEAKSVKLKGASIPMPVDNFIVGMKPKKTVKITREMLDVDITTKDVVNVSEHFMTTIKAIKQQLSCSRRPRTYQDKTGYRFCITLIGVYFNVVRGAVSYEHYVSLLQNYLKINDYYSKHLVLGYWDYSRDLVMEQLDNYNIINEIPDTTLTPLYKDDVPAFPSMNYNNILWFNPITLFKYTYGSIKDNAPNYKDYKELFELYIHYYEKYKYIQLCYKELKKQFTKACNEWNIYGARIIAVQASQYVDKAVECADEYYSNVVTIREHYNSEFKHFDPIEATVNLKKELIAKSEDNNQRSKAEQDYINLYCREQRETRDNLVSSIELHKNMGQNVDDVIKGVLSDIDNY